MVIETILILASPNKHKKLNFNSSKHNSPHRHRKVKNVTNFPWQSLNKNIIILGDSANATAPNLAQGAGLAIESAWILLPWLI